MTDDPEESIAAAKRAIASTRATIPVILKTVEQIRDQAASVAEMLKQWAEEDPPYETEEESDEQC